MQKGDCLKSTPTQPELHRKLCSMFMLILARRAHGTPVLQQNNKIRKTHHRLCCYFASLVSSGAIRYPLERELRSWQTFVWPLRRFVWAYYRVSQQNNEADMTRDHRLSVCLLARPRQMCCREWGCTRRRFTLDCIFTDCTGSDVRLMVISWWEIGRQ